MSDNDDRSLRGRIALITGANTGIGRITALELARRGAEVWLAGRSAERTQPVLDRIAAMNTGASARFLPLELGDLDSVHACAEAFLAQGKPLHLLVNNAGLAGARGLTVSGFEVAFGVNHVGHFLLTDRLLPCLRRSAPSRIITVASRAHRRVSGLEWESLRRPTQSLTGIREYARSKLANILFSAELGRRLAGSGVSTCSLHPGVIDTDVWRTLPRPLRILMRLRLAPVETGARTTLYCATDPAVAADTGLYYSDERVVEPSAAALDSALAAELWRRSERWIARGA